MEEINIKNILNTYRMFSRRQSDILRNLAKKKEVFTFDDLQKELQEDTEAKELLQKIRLIVNGEYEKAGVYKSIPTTTNNNIERIDLFI